MLVVTAKFDVKPGKKGALLEAAKDYIKITRTDPGCLSFNLYSSTETENQLMFFEEWENRASLDAHAQSAHMKRWKAIKSEFAEGDSVLQIYNATE